MRRYMSSAQNSIVWLNEYKNTLPSSTLGMIKGIAGWIWKAYRPEYGQE